MKRARFIIALILVIFVITNTAYASQSPVNYSDIKINFDEKQSDSSPLAYKGSAYLPYEEIASIFHLYCWASDDVVYFVPEGWRDNILGPVEVAEIAQKSGAATVEHLDINVVVNELDVPLTNANGESLNAFVYEDNIYLPIRPIAEALNINLEWNGDAKVITAESADYQKMKEIIQAGKPN